MRITPAPRPHVSSSVSRVSIVRHGDGLRARGERHGWARRNEVRPTHRVKFNGRHQLGTVVGNRVFHVRRHNHAVPRSEWFDMRPDGQRKGARETEVSLLSSVMMQHRGRSRFQFADGQRRDGAHDRPDMNARRDVARRHLRDRAYADAVRRRKVHRVLLDRQRPGSRERDGGEY